MRIALILVFIGLSNLAQGSGFAGVGFGPRWDSASSGVNYDRRTPMHINGGVFVFPQIYFVGELGRYSYGTESGALEITTEHYELLVWGRGSLWEQPSWLPYMALGLGFQKQFITTKYLADTRSDDGRLELTSGLGFGLFNRVYKNFAGGVEVRSFYRPVASPKNSYEIVLNLGYLF